MPHGLWFRGVFAGEEVIVDVILMIALGFDHQIQDVCHLQKMEFQTVSPNTQNTWKYVSLKKLITFNQSMNASDKFKII